VRRALAGLGLAVGVGCGGGAAAPTAPDLPRPSPTASPRPLPNIVLILADDLDAAATLHMPHLRAHLQDQGMTFTESFTTTPLCGPSRATLLSGQYGHNHGIENNLPPEGGFQKWMATGKESSTVATWLREAGYRTALVGKYVNRYPEGAEPTYVPAGWDDWYAMFSDRGSDAYYYYSLNENGTVSGFAGAPSDYITDVISDKAVEFLRKAEARDAQPFFVHISPNAPHRPAEVAPRHQGSFGSLVAPRVPSFNEEDLRDKPRWYSGQPILGDREVERTDRLYRDRLGTLLAVDEMIDRLMRELGALGELDNTYVFFTSDNGFLLGQHRFPHGKDAPYEESIRVPLIVRGPDVPQNRRHDALVANIDLASTFVELGRGRVPDTVDGRSLVPLLGGATPAGWREDLLIEHWTDSDSGLPDWFGVRTRTTVYVEYPATREIELYDLRNDPYQMESQHLAADAATLQRLSDRVAALAGCRGAACRQ
jgi:arylsulfatase A-like enzyme